MIAFAIPLFLVSLITGIGAIDSLIVGSHALYHGCRQQEQQVQETNDLKGSSFVAITKDRLKQWLYMLNIGGNKISLQDHQQFTV